MVLAMEAKWISLIVCGCIVAISIPAIIIKYFLRNKKTKTKEFVEKQLKEVEKHQEEKSNK